MFKCKCCTEKEIRISELKEQIAYFKSVLHPAPRNNYQLDIQEDVIMSGGGQEEIDLEAESKENERIKQEEDMIFSGNTEDSE